jgi:hypothetical protein
MKTSFSFAVVASLAMFTIAGCANRQSSQPTASDTNPASRTYTREDLNKTGRQQTGPALEAADPSVQAPGGR